MHRGRHPLSCRSKVRWWWIELTLEVCEKANALLVDGDELCHEHYLSLGLGFLHTFIRASHEDQMTMLRENLGISYSSLSDALEEEAPEWDDPMYDAWKRKDTLVFHKDGYKDGPNAAWPWSTGNQVEIRYNQPDTAGLRKWGYVMWDKDRLDRWSILQENPGDYLHK